MPLIDFGLNIDEQLQADREAALFLLDARPAPRPQVERVGEGAGQVVLNNSDYESPLGFKNTFESM